MYIEYKIVHCLAIQQLANMNDIRRMGILFFKTMDEWYYKHTADVINDIIPAML